MNPKTILKLREIPEVRELIDFLKNEVDKLNTLHGFDVLPLSERDVALSGRLWAHKTLSALLAPLTEAVDSPLGANPEEYVV